MSFGATPESRLAIRPHAFRAAIAMAASVGLAVFVFFGATAHVVWVVFFAVVAVLFYVQGVTIDGDAGIVRKRGPWGLVYDSRPLAQFSRVVLTRVAGKQVSFQVRLCGDGEPFDVFSRLNSYFEARDYAERVARFLGLGIDDSAVGETVAPRRRDRLNAPEPMPPDNGYADETDLLAVKGERPENWEVVLIAVAGMPLLCVIFVPNLLLRVITGAVGAVSIAVFLTMILRGVLIDRRRRAVKPWRLHPRFGREYSLEGYQLVSVKPLITQPDPDKPASMCFVSLDGDKEPLHLNSYGEHAPARELAQRVADFLGFAVRDLTERA